jgi:hypothetical protein
MKVLNKWKTVFKEIIKDQIPNIDNQSRIRKKIADKVSHIFKVAKKKEGFQTNLHFCNFQRESFQI